jgi:hypothetical protein
MRIAAHVQYDTQIIQLFKLTNNGMLNLYTKHIINCETMAKIQDKQMANISSNDHVWHHINLPVQ